MCFHQHATQKDGCISGDNCSSGNLSAKALDATFNDIESRNDSEQDFDKEFDIQYNINTAIYLLP